VLQAYYWPDPSSATPLPCDEFHVRLELVDGTLRPRIHDFQTMVSDTYIYISMDTLCNYIILVYTQWDVRFRCHLTHFELA
jgi:hypothetical protein